MKETLLCENFKLVIERMMGLPIKLVSQEELEKIKRIRLEGKNNDGSKREYNFDELKYFKNLKLIVFNDFNIDAEEIEKIELNPSLEYIHFDLCDFKVNNFSFKKHMNFLMFDVCRGIDLRMLDGSNIESIKIVGSTINEKSIIVPNECLLSGLKELSLNNFNISNANNLLKIAPNINSINFDGSIVDDIDIFNRNGVKISYKEKYLDGFVN